MTIQYKNQGYKQASTGKTTVLTCPTDATIIIKSIYCSNNDGSSAILVNMNFLEMMLELNHKLMQHHKD